MPLKNFRLSERQKRRRESFKVFSFSLLLGALFGTLVYLILSASQLSVLVNFGVTPAIVVAIIFLFILAMKSVYSPEELYEVIPAQIFYNKREGAVESLSPRTGSFMNDASSVIEKCSQDNSDIHQYLENKDLALELVVDMVAYFFFFQLSANYPFPKWSPRRVFHGPDYKWWEYEKAQKTTYIDYLSLPKELKSKNVLFRFCKDVGTFRIRDFHLPHNTELKYSKSDAGSSIVTIKNRYCMIKLEIISGWWSAGLPLPMQKLKNFANNIVGKKSTQDDYVGITANIHFHASFNWFWSLFEFSENYFNWVEEIYDKVEEYFNYERDYEASEKLFKKD